MSQTWHVTVDFIPPYPLDGETMSQFQLNTDYTFGRIVGTERTYRWTTAVTAESEADAEAEVEEMIFFLLFSTPRTFLYEEDGWELMAMHAKPMESPRCRASRCGSNHPVRGPLPAETSPTRASRVEPVEDT